MLSEEVITTIILSDVVYTVTYSGKSIRMRPLTIFAGSLVFLALFIQITLFIKPSTHDITELVTYLLFLSFWMTMISYLLMNMFRNGQTGHICKDLFQVDAETNCNLSKEKDVVLFCITWLHVLFAGSISAYVWNRDLNIFDLALFALVPISVKFLFLATMKQLIAKRLRHIRTAEEYMERVEDTIFTTRQLLKFTTQLDSIYELLSTSYALFSFQYLMFYIYSVWVVYGAGMPFPYSPVNDLYSSLGVFGGIGFTMLLQAKFSSRIEEEVDEIILELDITQTGRPCTQRERKLISLFLLELQHTPVQLSALGLFDIALPGLSTACAAIISYLLVLLQFT